MMMDELDLLKKDWQKKEEHLPKISYADIYKMIWKKSSSIVKWIFYISILEFAFWTAINIAFTDAESWQLIKSWHIYEFTIGLMVVNYIILLYFIYRFFVNYRKISFSDSSKDLMKAILKVKRTVTQYVWFNLIMFFLSAISGVYGTLRYGPDSDKIVSAASEAGNETIFWAIIIGISIIAVVLLLGVIWLFYKLLYGLLLKRLRKNYQELKHLQV
jgi:hypothetical protein